ncbi:MAG: hypothetical protein ABJH45_20270 [Paracoccaceae bacterium]
MIDNVATYALTAFEDVFLPNVGDTNVKVVDVFTIPANATLSTSVLNDDLCVSDGKPNSEIAKDSSNQQATIKRAHGELDNKCQENAEAFFWETDQPDNASQLIEIELEGECSDNFTSHAGCGTPAVGTDLKAVPMRDFGSDWIDYKSHKCSGRGLFNV